MFTDFCDWIEAVLNQITLEQALHNISVDGAESIPAIVKLLENPSSPLALPGKISLYNHDCLHVLLDKGISSEEEAYVIGFTMGNDPKCNWIHVAVFKFFSQYIYPQKFKFDRSDLQHYDAGFNLGKKYRNIIQFNSIDFTQYQDYTVQQLKQMFLIESDHTARSLRWSHSDITQLNYD